MNFRNSTSIINSNMIVDNMATAWGGGISSFNSNLSMTGNTISGNFADDDGGGMYCDNSTIVIINNIIWANSPSAIFLDDETLSFIAFSDIQGGWEGMGNIDSSPMFVDPSTGDYNICSQSPCIDAGDPAMQDPDSTRADIGFFYPAHPECFVGNVWHVSTSGNDLTGDGSYNNPFRTIQHAIDVSIYGDTVVVANGTYVGNITIHGKNVVLASNFIYTRDTFDILNTIIDGDEDSSVITTISCDRTTIISGFTITNGYSQTGAGIYCHNNSNPIISFNDIRNNESFWEIGYGGGISCYAYSNPEISNNIIRDNVAHGPNGGVAGGIYTGRYSSPDISNNYIYNNSAGSSGGAIACYNNSDPNIKGNVIRGNYFIGNGRGGGIITLHSAPHISNNVIVENHSGYTAGGIYSGQCSYSNPIIINNTIIGNTSDSIGGGLFIECTNHPPILKNTIIWANNTSYEGNQIYIDECEPLIEYCNIQDSLWPGIGNISVDPLFRDTTNGNYRLMATICGDSVDSPCIDAGDPSILDIVLDCDWGLGTIISDMGAYGGGDSTLLEIEDYVLPLPQKQMLFQNYPNPFNSKTTIKFELLLPQNVRLTIYDLLGRQVRTLIDEYRQAGTHTITFNAFHLSSGVYFYSLQAGEMVESKRMVLIK
jgi:hypothetical protein